MSNPNDYELGYDEGYQDGTAMSHELAGLVTERDQWKARAEKAEATVAHLDTKLDDALDRAEKAEAALKLVPSLVRQYVRDEAVKFADHVRDETIAALKEQGQ